MSATSNPLPAALPQEEVVAYIHVADGFAIVVPYYDLEHQVKATWSTICKRLEILHNQGVQLYPPDEFQVYSMVHQSHDINSNDKAEIIKVYTYTDITINPTVDDIVNKGD